MNADQAQQMTDSMIDEMWELVQLVGEAAAEVQEKVDPTEGTESLETARTALAAVEVELALALDRVRNLRAVRA